jgi:hypothetical protein
MSAEWNKEFPIVCVSWQDVASLGVPAELMRSFTDEQMRELASMMADLYPLSPTLLCEEKSRLKA